LEWEPYTIASSIHIVFKQVVAGFSVATIGLAPVTIAIIVLHTSSGEQLLRNVNFVCGEGLNPPRSRATGWRRASAGIKTQWYPCLLRAVADLLKAGLPLELGLARRNADLTTNFNPERFLAT
jgi:hypothetical protein